MYYSKSEIIKQYANVGLACFPCHTLEENSCSCGNPQCGNVAKHPLTENGCKDATTNPEILETYFADDYAIANVGIATGSVSDIWVVDVDDDSELQKLIAEHGELPTTPTVKTGRGTQYYFRLPDGINVRNSTSKIANKIDVRGEGGYVIAPPSVHASGNKYEWLVDLTTPFAYAPAWLLAKAMAETSELTLTETSTVDRIAKYLEKCPAAVSGQRGHDTLFTTVCKLFETFGELRNYSDDEIITLLMPYNERCNPPWSFRELRHKITDARKKAGAGMPTVTSTRSVDVTHDNQRPTPTEPEDDYETEPEWPTLSEDAYYGIAGEFIKRIEPQSEADNAAMLLTLLNAFGVIVGRNPYMIAAGQRHHPTLFTVIVGQSSRARKGTSLGYVVNALDGVDPAPPKRINGLSSGEGVVAAVRSDEDDGKSLTIPDRRLWIVETEWGQPLRMMRREGNTLSTVLRNAWDGEELDISTKNPMHAKHHHIGIMGHITLDELSKYIGQAELWNGFANRFLWILSRRSKMLPHGGNVDLTDLKLRLSVITHQAKSIHQMKRDASANALWEKIYPELNADKSSPVWDAVTSRATPQVLRLSMLYALLDGTDTINEKHLKAALAVWRYADDSARLIFAPANDESVETKIINVLKQANAPLTKTEIRDRLSSKDRKTYKSSLEWLVSQQRMFIVGGSISRYTLDAGRWPLDVQDEAVTNEENGQTASGQTATDTEKTENIMNGQTDTATLGELLDWSNATGNEFRLMLTADERYQCGSKVWVTNETGLTDRLKRAIKANATALERITTNTLPENEFLKALDEALQPLN